MHYIISIVKSYAQSLKASAMLGRAYRLRNSGRDVEALVMARRALQLFAEPHIVRSLPPVGSALVCLTILIEELAHKLRQPGAEEKDLVDTIAFIQSLPPNSNSNTDELKAWMPYLETRLLKH